MESSQGMAAALLAALAPVFAPFPINHTPPHPFMMHTKEGICSNHFREGTQTQPHSHGALPSPCLHRWGEGQRRTSRRNPHVLDAGRATFLRNSHIYDLPTSLPHAVALRPVEGAAPHPFHHAHYRGPPLSPHCCEGASSAPHELRACQPFLQSRVLRKHTSVAWRVPEAAPVFFPAHQSRRRRRSWSSRTCKRAKPYACMSTEAHFCQKPLCAAPPTGAKLRLYCKPGPLSSRPLWGVCWLTSDGPLIFSPAPPTGRTLACRSVDTTPCNQSAMLAPMQPAWRTAVKVDRHGAGGSMVVCLNQHGSGGRLQTPQLQQLDMRCHTPPRSPPAAAARGCARCCCGTVCCVCCGSTASVEHFHAVPAAHPQP
jgi:hypothetical protein